MVAEPSEKKRPVPDFRPGDTVRVHIRVVEGDSERVQAFEGTVIRKRGRGDSQSFTVRKISFGVGVERTFPLFSPHIERVELVKTGRVRRARLYYLRGLSGRAARVTEEEVRGPKGGSSGAPPSAPSAEAAKSAAREPSADRAESQALPKKKADSAPQGPAAKALGAA